MSSSPGWKKPSGLMKRKIGRKSVSSPVPQLCKENGASPRSSVQAKPKKRRNPFGCANTSPRKSTKVEVTSPKTQDPQENPELFEALENLAHDKKTAPVSTDVKSSYRIAEVQSKNEKELDDTPTSLQQESLNPPPALAPSLYPCYPVDWCLKTRVRFMSDKSFAWAGQMKTKDEAEGLKAYVTQQQLETSQSVHNDLTEAKTRLQSCCMYWMHPNLPWLKLFPRIAPDKSIGPITGISQDDDLHKVLLADWTKSFTSAFQLLRSNCCPYFYLSCHLLTVLFRTSVTGGMEALLTPTSRGFREALKAEGVEFEMPLNPVNKSQDEDEADDNKKQEDSSCSSPLQSAEANAGGEVGEKKAAEEEKPACYVPPPRVEDEADDDEITATDEGASSWLETLGIDKTKYRSLDPNKVKLQRDIFRTIDNRPESLIVVEGASTFALYNFLLNCRTCIANTGSQAGIPPTILAPVAFQGATLNALKVKAGSIRQQQADGSVQHHYIMEVQGPLLPTSVTALHRLLQTTHGSHGSSNGDAGEDNKDESEEAAAKTYTATYSVHEPTTPFNTTVTRKTKSEDGEEEEDSGRGKPSEGKMRKDDEEDEQVENSWRTYAEKNKNVENNDLYHGAMRGVRLSKEMNNGRQAIREMECRSGKYYWTTT